MENMTMNINVSALAADLANAAWTMETANVPSDKLYNEVGELDTISKMLLDKLTQQYLQYIKQYAA